MAAIDKSIYEKFIIEAADQSKTVDISAGVIAFTYFENIFSPYFLTNFPLAIVDFAMLIKPSFSLEAYNRYAVKELHLLY